MPVADLRSTISASESLETRNYKQLLTPSGLTLFAAALLVSSLMTAPFLLSVSMWLLVAAGLWQAMVSVRIVHPRAHLLHGLRFAFVRFFQSPVYVALSFLLLAPAISYFWSENTAFWASQVRVRIPFFVLPLAFANLPALSSRQYQSVLYLLVWVMLLLSIGVGINFILHYDTIIADLIHGRPVPVPRNHIRFNLLLVTAILSGGWLWKRGFYWRYPWERTVLALTVLSLFIMIHLLSVRSGLAAMYIALFYTIALGIVSAGNRRLSILALVVVLAAPVIAYQTMPSLQQRIGYMRYDWEKYRQNQGGTYSDAQRWVSLEIGIRLWMRDPLLGIGAGDLPIEVQMMANDHYPSYSLDPRLPHNQFIYILCGTGLLGLCLSLIALFAPLTVRAARRFYLFAVFQIMMFVSFLVEYTLETAIGVAFYLFFTLWFMQLGQALAVEKTAKSS
jgi:O-antigen ligase